MLKLCCPECGVSADYNESSIVCSTEFTYIKCSNCSGRIPIISENNITKLNKYKLPPLPDGTLVKVINKEHPWSDDIGIIRGRKFKHYRIELHGQLIWMPSDWIISIG